jgi:ATP-dependent helicase/nuclease subunit A
VPIATTPLSVFASCPRRFRLRFLVGLDEPVSSGQLDLFDLPSLEPDDERLDEEALDPRALGRAAHRVLERWPADEWGSPTDRAAVVAALAREGLGPSDAETTRIADGIARFVGGPWARAVRAEGAAVERERPFVVTVGEGARRVALRGAVDLLVHRADGVVEVVDYKRSRPRTDLTPYAFQLRAYALAARRRADVLRVRAGILFLGASDEPVWLPDFTEAELADFEREVASLGERLADARWRDRWDPIPLERCQALRCGFVPACHGPVRG